MMSDRRAIAVALAILPGVALVLWQLPLEVLVVLGIAPATVLAVCLLVGRRLAVMAPPELPAAPLALAPTGAYLAHPAGADRKRAVIDTVASLLASEDLDDELAALAAVEADRVPDPPSNPPDALAVLAQALNDDELEP